MTATGKRAWARVAGRSAMGKPKQERRNDARYILKGAHIAFKGHRATTIDCTVRNMSIRGACLNVENSIGIPSSFDLVLDSTSVHSCRVTWRKAMQIGVE